MSGQQGHGVLSENDRPVVLETVDTGKEYDGDDGEVLCAEGFVFFR